MAGLLQRCFEPGSSRFTDETVPVGCLVGKALQHVLPSARAENGFGHLPPWRHLPQTRGRNSKPSTVANTEMRMDAKSAGKNPSIERSPLNHAVIPSSAALTTKAN